MIIKFYIIILVKIKIIKKH